MGATNWCRRRRPGAANDARGAAIAPPLDAAIEHASSLLPAYVVHGLDRLARSAPLWPIGADDWSLAVATVEGFAARWHSPASELGWSPLRAPYASLAGMGGAFVVARCGPPRRRRHGRGDLGSLAERRRSADLSPRARGGIGGRLVAVRHGGACSQARAHCIDGTGQLFSRSSYCVCSIPYRQMFTLPTS